VGASVGAAETVGSGVADGAAVGSRLGRGVGRTEWLGWGVAVGAEDGFWMRHVSTWEGEGGCSASTRKINRSKIERKKESSMPVPSAIFVQGLRCMFTCAAVQADGLQETVGVHSVGAVAPQHTSGATAGHDAQLPPPRRSAGYLFPRAHGCKRAVAQRLTKRRNFPRTESVARVRSSTSEEVGRNNRVGRKQTQYRVFGVILKT